jgi:O-antigen/teichoic acid export membrane protein
MTTFPDSDCRPAATDLGPSVWESTRTKTVKGFGWQTVNMISRQGLSFLAGVALARILSPADFGLVGISMMFCLWIGILGDAGIGATLIREGEVTEERRATAFWVSAGVGLFSACLLLLLSPAVSRFYGEPRLGPLLRLYALALVLGGFNVVPGALLRQALDFRRVAAVEISGTLTSGVVSVVLAALGWGVVSLPIGSVVGLLMTIVIYRLMHLLRGGALPSRDRIRSLGRFPIQASGARIAEIFRVSVDNALVGRLLGATALGFYAFSYNLIAIPEYRFVGLLTQVTFPALSRLKADIPRVRWAYLRITRYTSLVVLPVLTGLMLVADRLIPLIYGSKWIPAVPVLRVLCLAGIGCSLAVLTDAPLLALGRADWTWKLNTVWVALIAAGVGTVVALGRGLEAAAWVVSVAAFVQCAARHVLTSRISQAAFREALVAVFPAAAATALMAAGVLAARASTAWASAGWGTVLGTVALGATLYGITAILMLPELRASTRALLRQRRSWTS